MENGLPKGWVEVELKFLGEYINGRAFKPSEWKKTGLPIIRIQNLNNQNAAYNYSDAVHEEKFLVKKGNVLMAWSASLGVFIWDKEDAWLNQHIFKVIPKGEIVTKKFLFYGLKHAIEQFYEKTHGTGMVHITKPVFEAHKIPLAPLPEQKRIVAKLDDLLGSLQKAQTTLNHIPQMLKAIRQKILTAAVSGELTKEWRRKNKKVEIAEELMKKVKEKHEEDFAINYEFKPQSELPDTWVWVALGNYARCNRGRFSFRPRNDPRFFNGKYPFIQIGDLPREGGVIQSHNQTLNEKGLGISKMFPKGTVVTAIVGATIGNTGIIGYDMCFPDSMVGIQTLFGEESNLFVDFYLRSEKENFRSISYASGGQPNIKVETINTYPFPLPPLEEQFEIVKRVNSLFTELDSIESRYFKLKHRMEHLPQMLLAQAFRGELVPQNPKDEPAERLLERIKQEKENFFPKKVKEKRSVTI